MVPLSGGLDSRTILAALLEAGLKDRITTVTYGTPGTWDYDIACDVVVATQKVPYLESLSVMRSADVLLVIDAPLEVSPFFPSKLADYMGANRPILGITPAQGATADILRRLGQTTVSPLSTSSIADIVHNLWQSWRNGTLQDLAPPQDRIKQFSVEKVAGTQMMIFERMLQSNC